MTCSPQCSALASDFESCVFEHVPREKNTVADRLSTKGLTKWQLYKDKDRQKPAQEEGESGEKDN
jgi:hypothetical protein